MVLKILLCFGKPMECSHHFHRVGFRPTCASREYLAFCDWRMRTFIKIFKLEVNPFFKDFNYYK